MIDRNGVKIKKIFVGVGKEKPTDNYKTEIRHSVVVIIKNPKDNTYLCEDAKGRNCRSFVMGGIEIDETPEEAAIRETIEETGYNDITIDKISDYKIVNHFFAEYKGVNRYAYIQYVYGHINSLRKNKISDIEAKKHRFLWIKAQDLHDFINIPMNKYILPTIGEELCCASGKLEKLASFDKL